MIHSYNLSASLRHLIEDERASEVIVTAMFKLDNNVVLQNTGCMALTNLSADGEFIFHFTLPMSSVSFDCYKVWKLGSMNCDQHINLDRLLFCNV